MAINVTVRCKALLIEQAVTEWFAQNPSETEVSAKELLDFFVKKKIFPNNNYKSQVNTLLKRVYEGGALDLVPHASQSSTGMGTSWHFVRIESDGEAEKADKLPAYTKEQSRYRSSILSGFRD